MYEKLPQTMKDHGAFCLWQYEKDRTGRMTKVPYQTNGMKASSTDRGSFTSFDNAVSHMDGYSGIGLGVFDGFAAIDIDHCVIDGALSEMARTLSGSWAPTRSTAPPGPVSASSSAYGTSRMTRTATTSIIAASALRCM